jgi:pimeloyl-ACP methyl ester carboxylesterase
MMPRPFARRLETSSPSSDIRGLTRRPRFEPCWFGAEHELSFGRYHAAEAEQKPLSLVLCSPFGYEAMCAHRPYLHLAERLAARGFPVLRFDYHGTGCSAGDDRSPDRLAAWIRSVRAAIDEVCARSGCERVGLFGARLGSMLALLAAEHDERVAALGLWGAHFTGRSFLREELAVHRLRESRDALAAPADADADGEREALGFVLTGETLESLQALELSALTAAAPLALVLARDTPRDEARVAQLLESLGARVESAAAAGYAQMIEHSRAPDATWDRVAHFFETCALEETRGPVASARVRSSSHVRAATRLRSGPSSVRESACFFGPDERLFGVLTEPDAAEDLAGAERPMVVLLSGGVNPQVGTNRMHTRWARSWAALGLRSFRFDLSGIGDSGTSDGSADSSLYSTSSVGDVKAALDHLSQSQGCRRFVLIGLCSGAFVAFHSAREDERVSNIVLLNLLKFYWAEDDTIEAVQVVRRRQMRSMRYYSSALGRVENWQKLLHGSVDLPNIARHLAQRGGRRAQALAGYWAGRFGLCASASTRLASDFRKLAKAGVHSLVVYDGHEPMLDDFQEQLGADGPCLRERSLSLEVIDGADHIFSPVRSQARLAEVLERYLREHVKHRLAEPR